MRVFEKLLLYILGKQRKAWSMLQQGDKKKKKVRALVPQERTPRTLLLLLGSQPRREFCDLTRPSPPLCEQTADPTLHARGNTCDLPSLPGLQGGDAAALNEPTRMEGWNPGTCACFPRLWVRSCRRQQVSGHWEPLRRTHRHTQNFIHQEEFLFRVKCIFNWTSLMNLTSSQSGTCTLSVMVTVAEKQLMVVFLPYEWGNAFIITIDIKAPAEG